MLGWLNTVEAFQKTKTPIPLNLKVSTRFVVLASHGKTLRNHVLHRVAKKSSDFEIALYFAVEIISR